MRTLACATCMAAASLLSLASCGDGERETRDDSERRSDTDIGDRESSESLGATVAMHVYVYPYTKQGYTQVSIPWELRHWDERYQVPKVSEVVLRHIENDESIELTWSFSSQISGAPLMGFFPCDKDARRLVAWGDRALVECTWQVSPHEEIVEHRQLHIHVEED